MRQALELSTTTAPARAAMGPYSLLMPPPAENRAISTPSKESLVNTSTGISLPRKVTFFPRDRSEARGTNRATGNLRSSRQATICCPTAPVAPTTATLYVPPIIANLLGMIAQP